MEEFIKEMRLKTVIYSCDQCEYKTNLKGSFKTHIESAHNNVTYSCNQCEYKATLEGTLKTHNESVHGNKDDTVEDVCSTQNMIEDARARKSGQSGQQCDQCEYQTASKAMLRMHKRNKHKVVENETGVIVDQNMRKEDSTEKTKKYVSKRIKCEHCDRRFNKESRYQKHNKTDHVGLGNYVGTSKDSQVNEINNEITLLTLPYHLRRPREQQKQQQHSKSPSV